MNGAPRPAPTAANAQSRAHLTETAAGWKLVLALDPDVFAAIRGGADTVHVKDFTVSVAPNLVPGVPFEVESVRIVRADRETRVTSPEATSDKRRAQ